MESHTAGTSCSMHLKVIFAAASFHHSCLSISALKQRWTAVSLLYTEACRWANGGGVHVGRIRFAFNGPVCPQQSSARGRPSEDTRLMSSTVSDSWRPAVHSSGGRSVHPVPARRPGCRSRARVAGNERPLELHPPQKLRGPPKVISGVGNVA